MENTTDKVREQCRGAREINGVWYRMVNGKLEEWPVLRMDEKKLRG